MTPPTPESIVQRQLDAYNSRDVDVLMTTYADDVMLFEYPDTLPCRGAAQVRERMMARLSDPHLHARLIHRAVMGSVVIDHEEVTRTFPKGTGKIELRGAPGEDRERAVHLWPEDMRPPKRLHMKSSTHTPAEAWGITIRRARHDDAPEVAELMAALGYPSPVADGERRIAASAASADTAVFVAESANRVVGVISGRLPALHKAQSQRLTWSLRLRA